MLYAIGGLPDWATQVMACQGPKDTNDQIARHAANVVHIKINGGVYSIAKIYSRFDSAARLLLSDYNA